MRAFTLVEILVVMALIAILSLVFIPAYHVSKQQLAVQRSANKLSQDIRLVMEGAMSAVETSCPLPGASPTYKHGISLDINTSVDKYILFADCNEDGKYNNETVDRLIKEESFETGVEIYELNPSPKIDIVFEPPDPIISIKDSDTAIIKIRSKNYYNKTRTLIINEVGLVDVD